MGELQQQQEEQLFRQQQQQPTVTPPQRRYGGRGGGGDSGRGEIVEVQGGHIIRSTGRKDRHSKVCTAKGPRDRRVRLSAHTAIQFYDVQDRLGYDRPSKAVDWLIKNAQYAIDELAELPPWHPTTTCIAAPTTATHSTTSLNPSPTSPPPNDHDETHYNFASGSGGSGGRSSILPPSLDSDSIADTIKSFFPMPGTPATSSSYQNFPPPELLSRTSSHAQDLRLSLHSFQEPPLFHHHHQQQSPSPLPPANHQSLFSASVAAGALPFDAATASWSEQTQQRIPWNMAEAGGGGGAYVLNMPPQPQAMPLHSLLSQNQLFPQRGPLQSSNSPSVRAWAAAATDHGVATEQAAVLHPSVFTFGGGGAASFVGFDIPARVQGDDEEHDGRRSSQPSSASSASRH